MIKEPKVAVVGYGVIGQRLADGVSRQEDMELIGIVDIKPSLALRALKERGMPYNFFVASSENIPEIEEADIPVSGTMDDILEEVDIVLDATASGIGAKNKKKYEQKGVKAIFQGGEKNEIADVFFHGYANFEKGVGQDYLKLTSCNTTGLIRSVDCLDRVVGVEQTYITIIRRCADPGDTHRGYVDLAKVEKVPNHQAVDLMTIMPHVNATGLLVHVPTTHGHIISMHVTPKKSITREKILASFKQHPRIRVVKIEDGFNSNTAMFRYARDLGNMRGDMYEIAVFEETVGFSGENVIYAINIPQEAVVIPETMDAIRAAMEMHNTREEALNATNRYLGMSK